DGMLPLVSLGSISTFLADLTRRSTGLTLRGRSSSAHLRGAPSFRVRFSRNLGVGHGTHHGPNFRLSVTFDGCLLRATACLSPHDFHFGADLDIGIHHA